jgi:Fe-S-cluster containining protein
MSNQLSRKFLEENFVCKRCGNCCKWHGYVNVSIEEIGAIAKFLEIDFNEYMEKFVILRHDRKGLSLDEKANGSCIYYDETTQLCQIQAVKPEQCKKFPIEWNFENFEKECAGAACLISK